jgi:seryl-tRNA synthetase
VSIDIRHIRQSPGLYEQNCVDRRYDSLKHNPWRILELSDRARKANQESRPLRERINKIHAQLPRAERKDELLRQAKELQPQLAEYEQTQKSCEKEIQELAEALPNLTSRHTPVGEEPEAVGKFNENPVEKDRGRQWQSHVHIGAELDLLDFEGSASTSGWGWYFLKNEAALLEQALIQHALGVAMKRGWQIVSPPSMVYAHMADACGFQPRDKNEEQQIYAIQRSEKDATKPQLVMAGTAEIPLAGMKANHTFSESDLPLKVIGVSRCYRAEAGARGVDTKGLYRVHEFTKVEMFGWTLPDMPATPSPSSATDMFEGASITSQSEILFDEMLSIQQEILGSLGLHCRILEMPTHDLGASASRKRDIEALFPSRMRPGEDDSGWGELTSASICTDYQTRRLATRVKINKAGKLEFPHTVNGTALAVPRVLACILETHFDAERTRVVIPEVLRPYMGGKEFIERP